MNIWKYRLANNKGHAENKYEDEARERAKIIRDDFCSKNSGAVGCAR